MSSSANCINSFVRLGDMPKLRAISSAVGGIFVRRMGERILTFKGITAAPMRAAAVSDPIKL